MLELTPVLILTIIFGFIYAIVYLGVRRKEREALLAKGADPAIFEDKVKQKINTLRYGLFLVGIGLGILMGHVLVSAAGFSGEVAYFSMVFIFGGIALIISYFLGKKIQSEEDN